ncbi:MAG: FAD-binding protein [Oscillospiraceae bacterium]|nr:FAD-binding protein [Oscillospiraceae bacterium]
MEEQVFTDCYDVIIIGSGLAGLYTALQLAEPLTPGGALPRVLMLSKQRSDISGSSLAQGGVAAVLQEDEDDSFDLHATDTLVAGGYQNDVAAVDRLVREGPEDVRRVMELGVEFDRSPDGELNKTLEGGHSRRRIVHHADQTGKEMVDKLLLAVRPLRNVTLLEEVVACGAEAVERGFAVDILWGGALRRVYGSYLLLATGGIGRVYRFTTNPPVSTGDGIRIAYELGAAIRHLSYVQFHPTAFDSPESGEQFLISEAVRGEGATLLNCRRERFMDRYDPRLELAPRDVVSRAILMESRRTDSRRFYLDIRHKGKAFLEHRFPAIYAACLERGVDIAEDLIPIFPCQHYLMGGIDVDLSSRATLPRLYAAGECAHTGLHGGNRLASNSLPEALVFGRHAAWDILARLRAGEPGVQPSVAATDPGREEPVPEWMRGLREEIQETMQRASFVFPDKALIPEAARRMRALYERLRTQPVRSREHAEIRSLACVAALILEEEQRRS